MAGSIHVAGTRTFSAEVIDLARESGLTVAGLLEPFDRARVGTTIYEQPVTWLDDPPAGGAGPVVVGTGEMTRGAVVARLVRAGWRPVRLVHPTAHVATSARIEDGALVGAGVVVGASSRIGRHAVLGRGALVGHHTELGELATLGPGANVAGNVRIGRQAIVGLGALVRDHLTVGESAFIAMGSVVVSDVRAHDRVRGVPATPYAPGGP